MLYILILMTIGLHIGTLNRYNFIKGKTGTGYLADAFIAFLLVIVSVIVDIAWIVWVLI